MHDVEKQQTIRTHLQKKRKKPTIINGKLLLRFGSKYLIGRLDPSQKQAAFFVEREEYSHQIPTKKVFHFFYK